MGDIGIDWKVEAPKVLAIDAEGAEGVRLGDGWGTVLNSPEHGPGLTECEFGCSHRAL